MGSNGLVAAKFDCVYYDGSEADTGIDAKVLFEVGSIEIEYEFDGNLVTYRGKEIGEGHYELKAPTVDGKGTLHRFPESRILEGFWVEGGVRGMWRFTLSN